MAVWTNLFDIGPCRVIVLHSYDGNMPETLYEQEMAKGDEATFGWPGHESSLRLMVGSSIGIVNLESIGDEDVSSADRFTVMVELIDLAAVVFEGDRAAGIFLNNNANYALGVTDVDEFDFANINPYGEFPEYQSANPDPCVLSALDGPHTGVGIIFGVQAA